MSDRFAAGRISLDRTCVKWQYRLVAVPRNRRSEIAEAALDLFLKHGYEGTAVSQIAGAVGVSKAAVTFHYPAKQDLIEELATPLLDALDAAMEEHPDRTWPDGVCELAGAVLDVLIDNLDVAHWMDGDRSIRSNPSYGGRLEAVNETLVDAMIGQSEQVEDRVRALAALGGIWQPLRTTGEKDLRDNRDAIVRAALVSYARF